MHERDLGPPVRRYLEPRGYRVWVDPDGSDYLDVVARRGTELGLVELKLADWRKVLAQAIRRRGWADWVAVLVPRASLAAKILNAPQAPRARRVGVWSLLDGEVNVARAAEPLWSEGESHPFPELRERLLLMTDLLESGALAPGVRWNLPGAGGRLPGGRRSTRDWRLDEFPGS
ncbi:MAG TPA: hypothetical protein VEY07_03855 [Thermoplasmata archaeon]|nr:hypothetical protein [Thermoplasmata archaeon]